MEQVDSSHAPVFQISADSLGKTGLNVSSCVYIPVKISPGSCAAPKECADILCCRRIS